MKLCHLVSVTLCFTMFIVLNAYSTTKEVIQNLICSLSDGICAYKTRSAKAVKTYNQNNKNIYPMRGSHVQTT